MGRFPSKNKNVKYLLCVIDVFAKYAWVKPLKYKKGKTILNIFIEIVNDSNCKANKLWFDQGREFYNKIMQEWLDNNDIFMYSTYNEGKSVIAERFIRTLKAKIYKKMTVIDSRSYLSYLNKLLDQYIMLIIILLIKKPINADYSVLTKTIDTNLKTPKFKVNDRVGITKYKNIFSKGYTENWPSEICVINSALKTNLWTYKIKVLKRRKNNEVFMKKNCYEVNYK